MNMAKSIQLNQPTEVDVDNDIDPTIMLYLAMGRCGGGISLSKFQSEICCQAQFQLELQLG